MLLHFGQLHTFWESIISTKLETKNRFDICHALVFFMHHHWVYYCRVTEFWRYGNLKFEKTALDEPQNSQKSLTISTILGLVFQSYIELATLWYGNPVLKKRPCFGVSWYGYLPPTISSKLGWALQSYTMWNQMAKLYSKNENYH